MTCARAGAANTTSSTSSRAELPRYLRSQFITIPQLGDQCARPEPVVRLPKSFARRHYRSLGATDARPPLGGRTLPWVQRPARDRGGSLVEAEWHLGLASRGR